ncbi:MAG: CDP-alcohol phosphatidyltransferase family protein [Microthrixaceae bacterium]
MFDGNFRPQVEAKLKPVGHQIKRTGITADHLTLAGLVMAVGAAVVISIGWWHLGLLLVVLTGVPDLLDGAVAKASGTAGPRGAFFDSVVDRVTDALLFGAVAVNFSQSRPNWVWLPVAVLASASWVSYVRAKAESLGFDARGGLVERAERFIIFLVALLFPVLMIPALILMLGLNVATAGQRFAKVWKQASAETPRPPRQRRRPRRSTTTMSERWQTRRETRERRLASRR